jgi:hypothetical protein
LEDSCITGEPYIVFGSTIKIKFNELGGDKDVGKDGLEGKTKKWREREGGRKYPKKDNGFLMGRTFKFFVVPYLF